MLFSSIGLAEITENQQITLTNPSITFKPIISQSFNIEFSTYKRVFCVNCKEKRSIQCLFYLKISIATINIIDYSMN